MRTYRYAFRVYGPTYEGVYTPLAVLVMFCVISSLERSRCKFQEVSISFVTSSLYSHGYGILFVLTCSSNSCFLISVSSLHLNDIVLCYACVPHAQFFVADSPSFISLFLKLPCPEIICI